MTKLEELKKDLADVQEQLKTATGDTKSTLEDMKAGIQAEIEAEEAKETPKSKPTHTGQKKNNTKVIKEKPQPTQKSADEALEECETGKEDLEQKVAQLSQQVKKLEKQKNNTTTTQSNQTRKPQNKQTTSTKKKASNTKKTGTSSTQSGSSSQKTHTQSLPSKSKTNTRTVTNTSPTGTGKKRRKRKSTPTKTKAVPSVVPKKSEAQKEADSIKTALEHAKEQEKQEKSKAENTPKKRGRNKKTEYEGANKVSQENLAQTVQYIKIRKFVMKLKRQIGKRVSFNWFFNFYKEIKQMNEYGLITSKTPQFKIIKEIFTYLQDELKDKSFKEGDKRKVNVTLTKEGKTIYEDIIASKLPLTVYYVNRYAGLSKTKDAKKAKDLLDRMEKAKADKAVGKDDLYYKEFKQAIENIKAGTYETTYQLAGIRSFVNGLNGALAGLTGLGGLQGCGCKVKKKVASNLGNIDNQENFSEKDDESKEKLEKDKVVLEDFSESSKPEPLPEKMTTEELLNKEYEVYKFEGKWQNLFNLPGKGFRAMIYGLQGSGKSTMCLQLADYLGKYFGLVLYISAEEYGTANLAQNIERNMEHKGFNVEWASTFRDSASETGYKDLSKYDFVFIDSTTNLEMTIEEFKELKILYPDTAMILIFQTTKDGNFRGDNTWGHEVDLLIDVKNGEATAKKRYAGTGTLTGIFDN